MTQFDTHQPGTDAHLSVESQIDNGIDPDDTAPYLSPHRKDALRAPPFSPSPARLGRCNNPTHRYLNRQHPTSYSSAGLQHGPKRQHHKFAVQRLRRRRSQDQPGHQAGHRNASPTGNIAVLQPAHLCLPLVSGGHQAGREYGCRTGQARTPFCGTPARLHSRVVDGMAHCGRNGVR